jgi:hypothetical protein
MHQVRFGIVALGLLFVFSSHAEKKIYRECTVLKKQVRFVGKKPFCVQRANCKIDLVKAETTSIVKKAGFHCQISSAEDGCGDITWQDCLVDSTIPNDFDYDNCMSDEPGPTPLGCKLNIQAAAPTVTNVAISGAEESAVKSEPQPSAVAPPAPNGDDLQSRVTFKDSDLTKKTLSNEERSKKMLERANRMKRIVEAIGCKPTVVTPRNDSDLESDEVSFTVYVPNCFIREKSATCETKFESRNIPGEQLPDFKACQKVGSAPARSSSKSSSTSSTKASPGSN